jgi:ATP-binding cassette subfamily B protein
MKIAVILIAVVMLSTVFQWLMSLCTNKMSFYTIRDIRCDIFSKIEKLPVKYIDSTQKGQLTSRIINDIEIISDGLLQGFAQLFSGIVTIVGTILFMITINVKITIVVILLTPLSFLAASKITKLSHDTFVKQSKLRGEMVGLTEELVGNQKTVKAFVYEKRAEKRFAEINSAYAEVGAKATFYSSMTNPTTRFVNGLIYAAVGLMGAMGAVGAWKFVGAMSVGKLSSFLAYSNQYTKPFNEISGVVSELQNAVASAERVFAVIDEPEIPDDSDKETISDCDGTIKFENVSFSYSKDTSLIENFNLSVKNGQRIAIVGPTGCGKSTIINLLLRFYDTDKGKIIISGYDSTDLTRNSLRSKFGMVLQETWLFSGTVAENISYGKPDASRKDIENAAKAVYAHSFIKRLPLGYDTIIDENCGLSQGQKQLLCIARVMLMNPPMLILDEATSSIDLRTELKIQSAFEKLMSGKTSFIIAHRLSTIKNADLILVMKSGKIIECGNHSELLSRGGFYADLYKSQFSS